MDNVLFVLGDFPVTLQAAMLGGIALAAFLAVGLLIVALRASGRRAEIAGRDVQVVKVPAGSAQLQQGPGRDELDVVGMAEDG